MKFSRSFSNSLQALFESKIELEVKFVVKLNKISLIIPIENTANCHCKIFTLKLILKRKLRGFQKSIYWVGQKFSLHETGFVLKIKCLLTCSLRLLQTFAGVLQKKIRTRAVFKKTHTNYTSIERL